MQQENFFPHLQAQRMQNVPKSFIREILKVAISPEVISFAGGLPNKELFPMQELHQAADNLLSGSDRNILQYSNTEGYMPLREKIAQRYKEKGLDISPRNILITNGSQQGLDLLGKIFINPGDSIIIEEPGYLGAIQALSVYQPEFLPVRLNSSGIDTQEYFDILLEKSPKLAYLIPNFQNPSGLTYTEQTREKVAEITARKNMYIIEDDPYGEIRFKGTGRRSFYHYLPDQTILLGTFSKTVVPAFRLGWIVAPDEILDKLIIAKQAADLHTDYFTQRLIDRYLQENDINLHIQKIRDCYGRQAKAMVEAIHRYLPKEIKCTDPEGGMFLWITLPQGITAMQLFERCISRNVAFVPGDPFYIGKKNVNTCRLNFSCADEKTIEKGIILIAECIEQLQSEHTFPELVLNR